MIYFTMWSYDYTGASSIFQEHQRTVVSTRGLPHDEGLIASLIVKYNLRVIIIDDINDQAAVDAGMNNIYEDIYAIIQ